MTILNKIVICILIGVALGLGAVFFLIESSESQKKNVEQKEVEIKKIYSGSIDGVARPKIISQ